MLRRRQPVQNRVVASQMSAFFRSLPDSARLDPGKVALSYARYLWNPFEDKMIAQRKLIKSPFYISLATDSVGDEFEDITKRATLVSDTLLLSHGDIGSAHQISLISPVGNTRDNWFLRANAGKSTIRALNEESDRINGIEGLSTSIKCPDLMALGKWILDAEPLLKAGLSWYLPSYRQTRVHRFGFGSREEQLNRADMVKVVDYLIQSGRAVDASGAEPIKSQLVRPILSMDLPYIEGVDLREFGKITVEEFDSYAAFRDFLRQRLLDIDESMNAVQSERELAKLGLEIKDQARSAHADMAKAQRKTALAAVGVTVASTSAVLVAVYGPALAAAVAAVGASGSVWGLINTAVDTPARTLREDKWYYVWMLAVRGHSG